MNTRICSPPRSWLRPLCWCLGLIFASCAMAADKPVTLTGTISLGSGRFSLETADGKIITFMGKGGNKVFSKCRNGDQCEITGTVVYNTRIPLFITVTRVKKLGHTPKAKPAAQMQNGAGGKDQAPAVPVVPVESGSQQAPESRTPATSEQKREAGAQTPAADTGAATQDSPPNTAPASNDQAFEPPLLTEEPAVPPPETSPSPEAHTPPKTLTPE